MSRLALFYLTLTWAICSYAQIEATQNEFAASAAVTSGKSQVLPQSDADFLKQLIIETGCRPTNENKCEITVKKASDLFQYIGHCNALSGWIVHFIHSPTLKLDIKNDENACQMTFTDTHFSSPQTVTCHFTQDQINKILKDLSAGDALLKYEKSGQQINEDLLSKAKLIVDCVKPISERNRYEENPNSNQSDISFEAPELNTNDIQ